MYALTLKFASAYAHNSPQKAGNMQHHGNLCAHEVQAPGRAASITRSTNKDQCGPVTERYISRRELRQLFPVTDMTIWRWQHDPGVAFPAPVKLAKNGRNYWWLPAIRDWARRRTEPAQSSPTPQRGVAS
jgi:predicted DNA-binding transcriptional regulator AlpA